MRDIDIRDETALTAVDDTSSLYELLPLLFLLVELRRGGREFSLL